MNATAALFDLRQPTCTEALSPAMQNYLLERVRGATATVPQQWQINLYQALGDARSAEVLCQDLLAFAEQKPHDGPPGGLVAVFECAPDEQAREFAPALWRHLQLMCGGSPRLRTLGRDSGPAPDEDLVHLRIDAQDLDLIVMHAEAERLSRVMPCPVLIFQRCG